MVGKRADRLWDKTVIFAARLLHDILQITYKGLRLDVLVESL